MKTIFTLLVLFTTVTFTVDSQNQGYDIGDVATDFKLKNIDGNTISLSDFKEAKGFIVIFTCNTCPYAVAYEDRIEALNKKCGVRTEKNPQYQNRVCLVNSESATKHMTP